MTNILNQRKMLSETLFLSTFSVGLQGLGLLLNIFLTKRLGAATVGELTLIGSFYGLAAVLSGGSGFIATSRFLSEELGCGGNPHRVFQYASRFCMGLSLSCTALLLLLAPFAADCIGREAVTAGTIRLLSISLPLSAWIACLKGRCYAYNRVYLPALSECIEFIMKAAVLAFCTIFLIPNGRLSVLNAFAAAMLLGQGSAAFFLVMFRMPHSENCTVCSFTFGRFIRLVLPVIGNASLVALLSSTNDALVPLTLLQFGNSTEQALAQFGEFEAIIIPTLFFPSVIQCCMSGLLVPELSRCKAAKDSDSIRMMTQRVLEQTIAYALFVAVILLQFGVQIGTLLGGDQFTGHILQLMAPVVPFIYLEIIMEGILRGLGRHNFSTVNYLAEYMVRISVLLICVPLFGFYGIVASYMACNLTGNAVRLYFVLRQTQLRPVWSRILLRPLFSVILSWQLTLLTDHFTRGIPLPVLLRMVLFVLLCGGIYRLLLRYINKAPRNAEPLRKTCLQG
ncbi:MAG: polysaccharide biosynthesis C-terminal domain-containing protein [Oscillospiraceae bacterium]|nr:polysaccharide biosynthesis C-terminal domain-containing protein [Oscillospiraceae bacterium]